MNILLVNNGGIANEFYMGEKRFPIGLGYLSAMLKARGHSTFLVDRYADPGEWVENIHNFDFVGIYASTPCFQDVLTILDRLEKEGFKGPIALGGPHTTAYPKTIPPRVDYVVQGEAEYIINDIVEGKYPSGVILQTPRIKDLDDLPRADYDLFLDKKRSYLWNIPFTQHEPIFLMNTARSCPFTCTFCSVRDIWGKLWTAQSAERIVDDILFLKKTYGIAGIYFREDIFTADQKRVYALCELLLKKGVDIVWACETRVDAGANREMMEIMARSGCKGIYIGAESGSQRMLDYYHKQITVDQIVKTCRWAKKYNIVVAMSLIINHPKENWLDKLATEFLIWRTKPDMHWKNRYRSEFVRSGTVDYPTYDPRQTVQAQPVNGTWIGQKDRLGAIPIGTAT